MPFSESVRRIIQRKAHFRCCLCHELEVEIHHILPQAEGGPDTEDNAAPLCPSCHERYGANPQKRKFIREARDFWFEICSTRYSGDAAQLDEIRKRLETVATKDDVKQLAIRNVTYVLGGSEVARPVPWESLKYSFDREEFIHPRIVQELIGWISDRGSTVAAVDVGLANHSNRFYGAYLVAERDGRKWPTWKGEGRESFCYSHVASSPSGVHMVECYDCGGGTGVFGNVALFAFEGDTCLTQTAPDETQARSRILLKILGTVALADRYIGNIGYRDGKLHIGPDTGRLVRDRYDFGREIAIE
jgi:hypothetical protein